VKKTYQQEFEEEEPLTQNYTVTNSENLEREENDYSRNLVAIPIVDKKENKLRNLFDKKENEEDRNKLKNPPVSQLLFQDNDFPDLDEYKESNLDLENSCDIRDENNFIVTPKDKEKKKKINKKKKFVSLDVNLVNTAEKTVDIPQNMTNKKGNMKTNTKQFLKKKSL
jgi:hypothetical protein